MEIIPFYASSHIVPYPSFWRQLDRVIDPRGINDPSPLGSLDHSMSFSTSEWRLKWVATDPRPEIRLVTLPQY